MTWQSPARMWLLLGVVALGVAYLVLQRRRSRYAVRFTNLRLLDRVAPVRPAWRRHVPACLFLTMLAVLVVGFARPADDVRVPRERATIIVAVDVSPTMLANDVYPDRLDAAKAAASKFADALPKEFNIGLVAFAGSAAVLVPAGTDRRALHGGIRRLTGGSIGAEGTAIGEAINTSLQAVKTLDPEAANHPPPARIVLLSDGANNSGRDPLAAAGEAAKANIPVHAIAFGTPSGHSSLGGRPILAPVDSETLRAIAEQTQGSYHQAVTSAELRTVYKNIGSSVGYRTERQDISAWFIGMGLLLAILAAAGSMVWFARLP